MKKHLSQTLFPLFRFTGIFLFASVLLFLAIRAMPGDPVALRIKNPDPERIEQIRNELGLNDSLPVQYGRMVSQFISGQWQESLVSGRAVRESVARFLPATLELGFCALVIGAFFGLFLVITGYASGFRIFLLLARALSSTGLVIPIFWIGMLGILAFSVRLGWVPSGGRFDYTLSPPEGTGFLLIDSLRSGNLQAFQSAFQHLILPVLTLAFYPAAVVSATAEARLRDPANRQLVQSLKARGFSSFRIWGIHIPFLLAVPIVTVLGTQAGALIGGAVLTETVFSWPGMGRFLLDGVLNRDLFVVQNGLLLVLLLSLALVTCADLFARIFSPPNGERKVQA